MLKSASVSFDLDSNAARRVDMLPLEIRDLSYHARGQYLIRDFNLSLSNYHCTAIMGFNGAGKSLLLKLLHGLIKPSGGTIQWGSVVDVREIRFGQAMVFQRPILLRRSVAANISYALKHRGYRGQNCRTNWIDCCRSAI